MYYNVHNICRINTILYNNLHESIHTSKEVIVIHQECIWPLVVMKLVRRNINDNNSSYDSNYNNTK